ncbi:MAG: ASCH domain-containing protein [Anaerolineales bacterium]|nr:ASCH domain-containing protein [Anaerolineales bacterium]
MKLKALSFRQPWAGLVLEGRKTLDLRTWSTHYRGPLAIYASLEVEKEACQAHGVDIAQLTTGALIGIVDLVDVIPLDEAAYNARQAEHLGGRRFRPGLFGWVLTNPRPLDPPQVVKGRLNLFDVDIQTVDDRPQTVVHHPPSMVTSPIVHRPPSMVASSEFELRVLPETGNGYRLEFTQKLAEAVPDQPFLYQQPTIKTRVSVELGGDALRAIADQVIETLRQNGYKPTDLSASRREPFHLDEQTGVRLGLIFLAVKPITKTARIEAISQGVRGMTAEELYYWYSKCSGGPAAERAQKALRILLSSE